MIVVFEDAIICFLQTPYNLGPKTCNFRNFC